MPYLETIAEYINQSLCKSVLNNKRFQNVKLAGIATPVYYEESSKEKAIACIIDNNGEADYVGVDDGFDLIIYHKTESISVTKNKRSGSFGDSLGDDVNTAKLSLIVYGSRKNLKITADEMALYIESSFPDFLDNKTLSRLQFRTTFIKVTDVNLNTMQVFKDEYENIDYFLTPEQFLFKLNYSVESSFMKSCFTTCK